MMMIKSRGSRSSNSNGNSNGNNAKQHHSTSGGTAAAAGGGNRVNHNTSTNTSTNNTKRTRRMCNTEAAAAAAAAATRDLKYDKRKRQKQQEQRFLIVIIWMSLLGLLALLCLLLVLLWYLLSSTSSSSYSSSSSSSSSLMSGGIFPHGSNNNANLPRSAQQRLRSVSSVSSSAHYYSRTNEKDELKYDNNNKNNNKNDWKNHPAFVALAKLDEAIKLNLPSDNRIPSHLLVRFPQQQQQQQQHQGEEGEEEGSSIMQQQQQQQNPLLTQAQPKSNTPKFSMHGQFFRTSRHLPNNNNNNNHNQNNNDQKPKRMVWQDEWDQLIATATATTTATGNNNIESSLGPKVDYTQDHLYEYPTHKLLEPPIRGYPALRPLLEIFQAWPQDAIDDAIDDDDDDDPRPHHPALSQQHQPTTTTIQKKRIQETLQHFDFTNATELNAALLYRKRKLPFKLTHVPELLAANKKWTDDYVSQQFDGTSTSTRTSSTGTATASRSKNTVQGKCQESPHSFFAFFIPAGWNVETMGLPPTRNNDLTFRECWSQHARYADATQLDPHKPHFYWQAGVPKEERQVPPSKNSSSSSSSSFSSSWSFVSRDLPSFSSPDPTFVCWDPSEQKGIQCRFGERGVTTATHYDAGQNMIGMITGAKRYILHPPRECPKLGIVTSRHSALFRHSLLNFGRYDTTSSLLLLQNTKEEDDISDISSSSSMSQEERAWLERAADSQAVETVLKAGEILYIPSHWFHYIIGLQKNAQCNVRSGVDLEGDEEFGGARHVSEEECDPMLL